MTAVPYLDRWLAVIGARRGPVFRPVDKWGNIAPRHLSARAVGHTVDRRRREAGLPPTTTHDYGRTFIGDVIDAGADLVQAQQLAGHKSPITTTQYDRRPARKRRAAVDRLHLPAPEDLYPKRRMTPWRTRFARGRPRPGAVPAGAGGLVPPDLAA